MIDLLPGQVEAFEPAILGRDPAMLGAPRYARNANDLYETPDWCTEVLCRHVRLRNVWEPACGPGKMVRVLEQHTGVDRASDLVDYGWNHEKGSFLDFEGTWHGDIVTNPPYSIQDEFVRHAIDIVKRSKSWRKVCMLLRNEYDSAQRDDLFKNTTIFSKKIVLTRRPRWIEGTKGSPRHNYAWFVWDFAQIGPPTIIYDR